MVIALEHVRFFGPSESALEVLIQLVSGYLIKMMKRAVNSSRVNVK